MSDLRERLAQAMRDANTREAWESTPVGLVPIPAYADAVVREVAAWLREEADKLAAAGEADGTVTPLMQAEALSTLADAIDPQLKEDHAMEGDLEVANIKAEVHAALIAERDHLNGEIKRLASFIMTEVPGEPSQSQGAADTAIRVIRTLTAQRDELRQALTEAEASYQAEIGRLAIERDRLRQDLVEMSGKHRQAAKDRDEARADAEGMRVACALYGVGVDPEGHYADTPGARTRQLLHAEVERDQLRAAVYVVMIQDRHVDPEPFVFSTAEAAIAYARQQALVCASSPDEIEEQPIGGWLYYARYSGEGDSVWVVEKRLDAT